VTRLRKHFRARWAAELAAVAALIALVTFVAWASLRSRKEAAPEIVHEPTPVPGPVLPAGEAGELRRAALQRCTAAEWIPCLEGLDRAKALDPLGDDAPEISEARRAAGEALKAPSPDATAPAPSVTVPKATPTSSAPVVKEKESIASLKAPAPVQSAMPTPAKPAEPAKPSPAKKSKNGTSMDSSDPFGSSFGKK
jgi:hypothetical protein